ncbi:MAG: DNA mismatch repair protein MutS [Bacilli bacterium]|nr:DNA mismatch repair protein MutS [Bacilli bacterium]
MKRNEVDRSRLSPMMKHYVELKDKYEDVIILYRLGDFYEMFFEDAEVVAHALELTLTGKSAGLEERVPMCGIPHHASEVYIDRLIKAGFKVAICEQVEDPKEAKGIVRREVTEVISSGTIINVNSLNEKENNYIGNLYDFDYGFVLTYADITTGEIYSEVLERNIDDTIYKILSLEIKELVVSSDTSKELISKIKSQKVPITYNDNLLENEYINIYKDINDDRVIISIKSLLYYLSITQKRSLSHFQNVMIKKKESCLSMDIHTKRNLELTECLRTKERTYSLLWLLDNTKTAMGSRKLKYFIENPLLDINMINKRYNVVEKLLEEFILAEELRNDLYEVYDLERLCGRISFGSANAKDMIQLRNSLRVLPSIKDKLSKINFYDNIEVLNELYELLDNSIYEDAPNSLKEGFLIKEGYSNELDELKKLSKGGKDFISEFEKEERERTGIKNLKVGFNKVFGYFIEVSKGNLNLVTDDMGYIRKQTLANCERFITPVLKEKEDLILSSEDKIINLEYNLFVEIRDKCKEYIHRLQDISKVISEIDVLQSFAFVSEKYNYVRPVISSTNEINILSSRHPVVEKVLKNEEYVPNDIIMDDNTDILLITGPNMAGKSTYMRQLGIIVIMAQIGCFVPAGSAILPIFDKIFTRIGASDDLVSGESTFMVEMNEASRAIKYATRNSLILFDELGRGTATFDGMSLAEAILEYIAKKIKCKTLFSTHYHELTDMENNFSNLINKHVAAVEEDGNITFLHKVKDGSVDKSYGINVAKLAGLPDEVIDRADAILKVYENKEKKKDTYIQTSIPLNFEEKKSVVEEEIKKIDILNITPIDAINILSKLKEKVK